MRSMSDMGRTSWWSHRTAEAPHAGLLDSPADSENARPPPKNSHLDSYRAREILRLDGWRRRKEGRRDRGDGDHLPQRHRGRSWSTRFYPFWRWHPPSISPPPPPSRRCCRMPMSCLVTEGDFSEHFPKRFRHAFLVLTRYFFHFFFFCQEPRSQVLLPRRRRGRPDGNRCCPSARRRGRGYAPCCPRERHPARRATVSAQFHSST